MSWFNKLKTGLTKSSSKISTGIADVITKRKLDDDTLEELEDVLLGADLGTQATQRIMDDLRRTRFGKTASLEEIHDSMVESIAAILAPVAMPLTIDDAHSPYVIMAVGVNGNGKTTTVGKLAQQYKQAGHSVLLCACDTFRAAAVEQLEVWAQRVGCDLVKGKNGADPASVAFEALEQAKAKNIDVLLIDTAGRLQNRADLMEELAKINRVLHKLDDTAPHKTLQVLDATTGQNAFSQLEHFQKIAGVDGLVVTKLDGTAKGGVVVGLAAAFAIPIHAVGVGESIDDLHPFEAHDFARSLIS